MSTQAQFTQIWLFVVFQPQEPHKCRLLFLWYHLFPTEQHSHQISAQSPGRNSNRDHLAERSVRVGCTLLEADWENLFFYGLFKSQSGFMADFYMFVQHKPVPTASFLVMRAALWVQVAKLRSSGGSLAYVACSQHTGPRDCGRCVGLHWSLGKTRVESSPVSNSPGKY